MTSLAIRQSGGASIVSIPKAVLTALGLSVGSKLDISLDQDKIVLTPIKEALSLNQLLEDSPKECFFVSEEDRQWIDAKPAGKEL